MFKKLFFGKNAKTQTTRENLKKAIPPFNWDGARIDVFGADNFEGVSHSCSIGKLDWVPVGIVMCRILHKWEESPSPEYYGESGTRLIKRFLIQRLHLSPKDSGIDQWLSINSKVLESVSSDRVSRADRKRLPSDYKFAQSLDHGGESMAELFLSSVERARPASLDRRMIYADSNSIPYWESDVMENAVKYSKEALELTTEIALSWLEFRGLPVDRELHLVKLDGYVPLTDYVENFF